MSPVISYQRVLLYGRVVRRLVLPNAASQAFQDMTGRLTLTEADCRHLGALGVTLQDVTAQIAARETEVR